MLETEQRNPKTTHIDQMTTREMIRVMNDENRAAVEAVADAEEMIAPAVDAAARAIASGRRIFYIGAGTSGRLGVIDAAECQPTFGVPAETVTGIIAGGKDCMFRAAENAEDKYEAGARDILDAGITAGDFVLGISAAGDAAYVLGALETAKKHGCITAALTCNPDTPILRAADLPICVATGAEVITGSTRLKAGTAQKLVLNMISTFAMVKTGKVYENMMINLKPSNKKLRARMIGILREILHCDEETALCRLERAGWSLRAAAEQTEQNDVPVIAEIRREGGVPTLFVNGKAEPGCAYITYLTDKNRYADFADAGYRLFSFPTFFATRPINEETGIEPFNEGMFEDGIRFELFDREVERILESCPDALIFPRVNTTLPRAWDRAHPEELCDRMIGKEPCVCFSSSLWLEEVKKYLALLIGHVQNAPYAAHIIGYQIAAGQTEEWAPFDHNGSQGLRSREAFSKLPDQSEEALWRYLSETTAQAINTLAAYVKKLTQGRVLTGAFYGYALELPNRVSAHHALLTVLESENVDFLCTPVSYHHRNDIAYDAANITALDSLKKHGKLYFAENDTRTHLTRALCDLPYHNLPVWFGPDKALSEEILKMHFARALIHGHAFWWFDMWGGWYADERYMALMKRFREIARDSLGKDRTDVSPVAVYVDERAYDGISDDAGYRTCYLAREPLGRAGVPYAIYLADDFDDTASAYPLTILLEPRETELTKAIREKHRVLRVTPDRPLTEEILREAYREAGIRPYTDVPAIVYENASYFYIDPTEDTVLDLAGRSFTLQSLFDGAAGERLTLTKGKSYLFEKKKR